MARYTIYEAKNSFSRLLRKAAAGEDVVIVNRDQPVARLVPVRPGRRKWGGLKGKIKLNPGWDAPIADLAEYLK